MIFYNNPSNRKGLVVTTGLVLMIILFSFVDTKVMAQDKVAPKKNAPAVKSGMKDLIPGKWILSNIEGSDTIEMLVKPLAIAADSKHPSPKISKDAVRKVTVQNYLKEQLSIGVTRFEFDNQNYKFYRKQELNQEGVWMLNGSELKLKYPSGGTEKVKINEILAIDDKELKFRTSSQNNIATLTFKRAE